MTGLQAEDGTRVQVAHGAGAVAVTGSGDGFRWGLTLTTDEASELGRMLIEQSWHAIEAAAIAATMRP